MPRLRTLPQYEGSTSARTRSDLRMPTSLSRSRPSLWPPHIAGVRERTSGRSDLAPKPVGQRTSDRTLASRLTRLITDLPRSFRRIAHRTHLLKQSQFEA